MTNTMDREMVRRMEDRRWSLPGLGAVGPIRSLKSRLMLFGQFVGDWDILPPRSRWNETEPKPSGEARFRWILGGTGVQDVWGPLDDESGKLVPQGSTLRFYDPSLRAWRSIWISPYQRAVRRFIGRKEGTEIVLREQDGGWKSEKWIFSEITRSSFRWRAEARPSPRGRSRVIEEYFIRRK
jgi:hypothetical protein